MKLSYRYSDDRREPEKTPLIDIIFLLLIFFFVSLAVVNFDEKPQKEEEEKNWLFLMPNVTQVPHQPFVLLQVRRVGETPSEIRNSVNNLYQLLAQENFNVNITLFDDQNEFMVFIVKDWLDVEKEYLQFAEEFEQRIAEYNEKELSSIKTKVEEMAKFLPLKLPSKDFAQTNNDNYQTQKSDIIDRMEFMFLNAEVGPELHLRLEDSIYYRFVFDVLKECSERNIQTNFLKFRVQGVQTS